MHGMTDERLKALAADALAGRADEAALIELSRSPAGRDALKLAMAAEADAEALAQAIASERGPVRIAHESRGRTAVRGTGRGRIARWAAVAAAVAFGFALMLKQVQTTPEQAPVASQPAEPTPDDRILAGDFEGAQSEHDALFVDDFGA